MSNARPEIADYAFTTLTPNLGVADIDDTSLLIADIPGLIEGASEGKGLGDAFLRHVERTAVLLHMIDAYSDDPAKDYLTIRQELEKYNLDLTKRPEIIVLTKTEGFDKEIIKMQMDSVKNVAKKKKIFAISSAAHQGLQEALRALRIEVDKYRESQEKSETVQIDQIETITLPQSRQSDGWKVEKIETEGVVSYRVSGGKIEKFASKTDFSNRESVNRLRNILSKMGIDYELRRKGALGDSLLLIGDSEFSFQEQ